ncbi:response regulator [Streptomyces sp. NPDC058595]|uniref:response regulator n=1 Tax=Streptomyces sp. NPDC058595 TaxID=3346550 RepID=UPI0036477785
MLRSAAGGVRSPVRCGGRSCTSRSCARLSSGGAGRRSVGEASTAEQALVRIPALRPRVAVLDVRLGDGDGVAVCRELRSRMPELACLMLTSFDDEEALLDAIMAGASGYVLKQITGTDLVTAVRTVASGQSMLDPGTTSRVMARLRGGTEPEQQPHGLADLTEREREILALVGEGLTNREIGKRLYLAEKTVKNNISRLLAKLGVERRVQAAVLATQANAAHDQHSTAHPALPEDRPRR